MIYKNDLQLVCHDLIFKILDIKHHNSLQSKAIPFLCQTKSLTNRNIFIFILVRTLNVRFTLLTNC